jgi:hypothetical protein
LLRVKKLVGRGWGYGASRRLRLVGLKRYRFTLKSPAFKIYCPEFKPKNTAAASLQHLEVFWVRRFYYYRFAVQEFKAQLRRMQRETFDKQLFFGFLL